MKYILNLVLLGAVLFLFYYTYKLKTFKLLEKEESLKISSKNIDYGAERKFLTALYREKHTGDCDHRRDGIDYCVNIKPEVIVVHMSALDSLEETFEFLKEPILRDERQDLEQRTYDRLNVSAHYVIDKDGSIYSLMPDNYFARHAIGLNHISIGIENVGLIETEAQVISNVKLIKYLLKKYDIKRLISHGEIRDLMKTNYYVEKVEGYFRDKDCGISLVKKIRNLL